MHSFINLKKEELTYPVIFDFHSSSCTNSGGGALHETKLVSSRHFPSTREGNMHCWRKGTSEPRCSRMSIRSIQCVILSLACVATDSPQSESNRFLSRFDFRANDLEITGEESSSNHTNQQIKHHFLKIVTFWSPAFFINHQFAVQQTSSEMRETQIFI